MIFLGILRALVVFTLVLVESLPYKPHIIYLLGDEIGWNNVGWHSNIPRTPNLDALAKTGVVLNHHYSQRWCAPTRASFLSGRYAYNTGINQYGKNISEERSAVPASFNFIPAILKKAGYHTIHLGKWHVGFFAPQYVPVGRGFDQSFGYMLGASSHDNRSSQISHTCHYPVKDLLNGTQIANTSHYAYDNTYSSEMYGKIASDMISGHNPKIPLFLYMAFQDCHAPYSAPKFYQRRFPGLESSRLCFNSMAAALDDAVGVIISALKGNNDMYNNSVIVFSSDNGGPAEAANNLPLRGAKFSTWEGGVRTVGFVHSPFLPDSVIGTSSDALIHISDWYSTFAAMANVSTKNTGPVPVDGYNVWPAVVGLEKSPRTFIVHEFDTISNIFAYRSGHWKISFGKVGAGTWNPDTDYKKGKCVILLPPNNTISSVTMFIDKVHDYTYSQDIESPGNKAPKICVNRASPCLFNIAQDPNEHIDLASNRTSIVARLLAEFDNITRKAYSGGLDSAITSQNKYCDWIKKVGWVQPYDPLPTV